MRDRKAKGEFVADYLIEDAGYSRMIESLLNYSREALTRHGVPREEIEFLETQQRSIFQAQIAVLRKRVKVLEAHVQFWAKPDQLVADPELLSIFEEDLAEHSPELSATAMADLRRRFPHAHLRIVR